MEKMDGVFTSGTHLLNSIAILRTLKFARFMASNVNILLEARKLRCILFSFCEQYLDGYPIFYTFALIS